MYDPLEWYWTRFSHFRHRHHVVRKRLKRILIWDQAKRKWRLKMKMGTRLRRVLNKQCFVQYLQRSLCRTLFWRASPQTSLYQYYVYSCGINRITLNNNSLRPSPIYIVSNNNISKLNKLYHSLKKIKTTAGGQIKCERSKYPVCRTLFIKRDICPKQC